MVGLRVGSAGTDASSRSDGFHAPSTVVVGTRDRGALVLSTIRSVLASAEADLELIVVDQSADDATADAVAGLGADPRLRYVRSSTVGVSRARNIGLRMAQHDVVLITDDDVEVTPMWVRRFTDAMTSDRRIGVGFCQVTAGPHDDALGFVPDHEVVESRMVRSLASKSRARGVGAGMAVRREAALALGGFDEQLGPGARLRSGEDRDLAARALVAGWWVCQTPSAEVIHHGFRTWWEGKGLARRDWYGIGAAYAKHLRTGRVAILPVIAHEVIYFGLLVPIVRTFRGERRVGLRRIGYFAEGLVAGLRTPIDRAKLVYLAGEQPSGSA